VGDGNEVCKQTVSSLISQQKGGGGGGVTIVVGVADPDSFQGCVQGVLEVDLWDKCGLSQTMRRGKFDLVFLATSSSTGDMDADTGGQWWRHGLQAAKNAGIMQVVLVSIGTGNPVAPGVLVELEEGEPSATKALHSVMESHTVTQEPRDLSSCIRVQRKTILKTWHPMKIKLVQITLPTNLAGVAKQSNVPSSIKSPKEGTLNQKLPSLAFSSSKIQPQGPSLIATSYLKNKSGQLMLHGQEQKLFQLMSGHPPPSSSTTTVGHMKPFQLVQRQQQQQQQPTLQPIINPPMSYEEILQSLQQQRMELELRVRPWL